jgi:metallo-beta-lactamase family protein
LDHPEWHQLSHEDCFEAFKVAKFVSDVEESRSLNTRKGPFIIISSSGMITGGRILHHVKHHGDDPRNMILLAGFQAPGTRGALLAAGSRSLKIHGQYLNILAEVIQSDYFSAHADQQQLLAWLMESEKMPGKVFLTHGEPQAADAFRRLVIENLKCDVVIPSLNQVAVFP